MCAAATTQKPASQAWEVVITEWALDSYLNLKADGAFTDAEYKTTIRPDVERLKQGIPSPDPKFAATNFWGPAKLGNQVLSNGYKMKWHNMGPGKVQLRLPVASATRAGDPAAFLCECYDKKNDKYEQRKLARFKTQMNQIAMGQYQYRGSL